MKKLLRNICILLLPLVLYYCAFLGFERNNYFGLRPVTPSGSPIGVLREYERHPQNSIIIGDSRTAHFDMSLVEDTAGRPFANIAYGGSSLKESIDLLEWWLEKYPSINEVVFSLSFHTLNANYQYDRLEGLKDTLYNPFAYLTNLGFNLDAMQVVLDFLQGKELYGGDKETQDPATYTYQEYTTLGGEKIQQRDKIAEYLALISPLAEKWKPNTEQFNRLLGVIETCTANGVRFTVVLPPMHQSIVEYIVQPLGIEAQMIQLVAALKQSPALVLDYEITGRPNFTDDMFYDGFHLDAKRGLGEWTTMLFRDINAGEQFAAA